MFNYLYNTLLSVLLSVFTWSNNNLGSILLVIFIYYLMKKYLRKEYLICCIKPLNSLLKGLYSLIFALGLIFMYFSYQYWDGHIQISYLSGKELRAAAFPD